MGHGHRRDHPLHRGSRRHEAVLPGGLRTASGLRERQLSRLRVRQHHHQPAEDHRGARSRSHPPGWPGPTPVPVSSSPCRWTMWTRCARNWQPAVWHTARTAPWTGPGAYGPPASAIPAATSGKSPSDCPAGPRDPGTPCRSCTDSAATSSAYSTASTRTPCAGPCCRRDGTASASSSTSPSTSNGSGSARWPWAKRMSSSPWVTTATPGRWTRRWRPTKSSSGTARRPPSRTPSVSATAADAPLAWWPHHLFGVAAPAGALRGRPAARHHRDRPAMPAHRDAAR
ncbi:hypothetical protein STENM327S_09339 [Streptomyces tendae]